MWILLAFQKRFEAKSPLFYTHLRLPQEWMPTDLFNLHTRYLGLWARKGYAQNSKKKKTIDTNKRSAEAEADGIVPGTGIRDDMGICGCRGSPRHFPTTSADRCLVCNKSPTKGHTYLQIPLKSMARLPPSPWSSSTKNLKMLILLQMHSQEQSSESRAGLPERGNSHQRQNQYN